jgi:hypothetical protein
MEVIRFSVGRDRRLHRAITLVLAGTATIALGCGDGGRERASAPQPTMRVPLLRDSAGWPHLAMSADSFCVDAVPSIQCRPFRIGGVAYTVTAEGHPENFDDSLEPRSEGVRQVRIYDDSARVVYQEDFRSPFADSTDESRNWVDVEVRGLEDAAGAAQAFLFTYTAYVRRETVPDVYHRIVAPRGDRLQVLGPKLSHSYYGRLGPIPSSRRGAMRLLDRNRFVVEEWRHYFAAFVPYHVDFGCKAGAETCLTLALTDSIDGLARFDVDAERQIELNYELTAELDFDTATVELFVTPGAERGERVRVGSREIKVLGGAGRVRFGRAGIDGTAGDVTKDDWLHIRLVNGRTGWIRGHDDFSAIGLRRVVRPTPGSEFPEPPVRTEMNDL